MQLRRQEDLRQGHGSVYMPGALDRKYPAAAREWRWRIVFPARDLSTDPRSGVVRRHHLDEVTIHRAIKAAVARVGEFQARQFAHVQAQLRDPCSSAGRRHADYSGTAGAQRCIHDDDLYSRAPAGRQRYEKPAGLPVARPQTRRAVGLFGG